MKLFKKYYGWVIFGVIVLALIGFGIYVDATEEDRQEHYDNLKIEYRELCERNNLTFKIKDSPEGCMEDKKKNKQAVENGTIIHLGTSSCYEFLQCYRIKGDIIDYYTWRKIDGRIMLVDI